MTAIEDCSKLGRMAIISKTGSPLKLLLEEVSNITSKVRQWQIVPTSGSAVCHYNVATGLARDYVVRYQQGNIGNLVHELIHVSVNERYKRDFVNYASPIGQAPDRTYDSEGRCTNEAIRQTKLMSQAENDRVSRSLDSLIRATTDATELTMQQRTDIIAKFNYGKMWPMKEYDTVISQVLVWLFEWGYPTLGARKTIIGTKKQSKVNKLYEKVEAAVSAAYVARQAAP